MPSDVPLNIDLKDLDSDVIKVRLRMKKNAYKINSVDYDYLINDKKISKRVLKPYNAVLYSNDKKYNVLNLVLNDDALYLFEKEGDYAVLKFKTGKDNRKNIYIVKIKGHYNNFNKKYNNKN